MLVRECEDGNIEYKRKISSKKERLETLASQMKWRLSEGKGICYYYIGVEDNGMISDLGRISLIKSLKNLKKVIKIIDSEIISIERLSEDKKEYFVIKIKKEFNSNYLFLF